YKWPHTLGDLQRCTQADDESSCEYLACWITINTSCENVTKQAAIQEFVEGTVRGSLLRHTLKRKSPQTLGEMIGIANKYADADDDAREDPNGKGKTLQLVVKRVTPNNKHKTPLEDKADGEMVVVAIGGKGGKSSNHGRGKKGQSCHNSSSNKAPRITYEEWRDLPFPHHSEGG
ncbi:hypothetical protein JBE27_53585, partial [Streptomyces albiflaviniger]|nr:hypothetical protein [Streptomyces albiflaviniger]